MGPILLGEVGSYEAVLSLNWKHFWLRTNRNIIGSLFIGWVMFLGSSRVVWGQKELVGPTVWCEGTVQGSCSKSLELELCSIKVLWILERSEWLCLKWWIPKVVPLRALLMWAEQRQSWLFSTPFGEQHCVLFSSVKCALDSSVPRSGRDGSSPGSCHHGLALAVVGGVYLTFNSVQGCCGHHTGCGLKNTPR